MNEKHTLVAFLSTLAAIVTLVIAGAFIALQGKSTEALGIGAAVTGLIGVIGTFRPRAPQLDNQDVTITNTPNNPAPVEQV